MYVWTNVWTGVLTLSLPLQRGSVGAYASGIYTVPEAGFYYVTMKLRVYDSVADSIGIEIKVMRACLVGRDTIIVVAAAAARSTWLSSDGQFIFS